MVKPNILITGTPGVGKTRLCRELVKKHKYTYLDVSDIAKRNKYLQGFCEKLDCPELDEEKLLDHMEPLMAEGGNIVEYHSCELFPERWFQAVFVVRCDNTILFDRLTERNYSTTKVSTNLECEIFMEVLIEAKDSYAEEIVHELRGDTDADFVSSVTMVSGFIEKSSEN